MINNNLVVLSALLLVKSSLSLPAAFQPNYTPSNLPNTSESGQSGTNACGTVDSQTSNCQTAYLNSVEDFCLWAPPTPNQNIGDSERIEVAWCTAPGHGARLIPAGTFTGVHYLETPHYTQVTGTGNFRNINIQAGDAGGELDPHGADGNGNPIGGLVFSGGVQVHEWTSFISDTQFCFRICKDGPGDAYLWCQHIYDIQGCEWNEPGNYNPGFDSCEGDSTSSPPGIYVQNGISSTYYQSQGAPPPAHTAGASSNCKTLAAFTGAVIAPSPTSAGTTLISLSSASVTTTNPTSSSTSSSSSSLSTLIVTSPTSTKAINSTNPTSTLSGSAITPTASLNATVSLGVGAINSTSSVVGSLLNSTSTSSTSAPSSIASITSGATNLRVGGLLVSVLFVVLGL